MKEKMIKYGSWAFMMLVTVLCAFFIVHNAQWIIGDDAIVMTYSGWGHWFPMSHTVIPESGRFFPLSYQMYNLYAPFFDGQMSAQAMYLFHAIIFALTVGACFWLMQDILKKREAIWRYGIALLATVFFIGRVFPAYMNCFSTAWFGTSLTVLMLLFAYLFYTRKKMGYGLAAWLIVVWITYTGENAFVLPLAWGACGLLLLWKKSTKWERAFHIGLVANAVIFLLVYIFFILLKIEIAYDGSHGTEVTFIGNMISILVAQKFLWIAAIVLCVRLWDVLKNKAEITFYDLFLLTAGAVCVGGFILKLNWVLYYNGAVLVALPAVVYYLNQYLKPYWTALIMLVFAGWYGIKVPQTIKEIDGQRDDCHQFLTVLAEQVEQGETVYFYMPGETNKEIFDVYWRDFIYDACQTFLRYYVVDKNLNIYAIAEFDESPGVYITMDISENLSPDGNQPIENIGVKIAHNEMRKLDAWIVE